jgi:hypothetical protein
MFVAFSGCSAPLNRRHDPAERPNSQDEPHYHIALTTMIIVMALPIALGPGTPPSQG